MAVAGLSETSITQCYVLGCTCLIKTNKMHFSFLIYSINNPVRVSNTVTVNDRKTVTVHVSNTVTVNDRKTVTVRVSNTVTVNDRKTVTVRVSNTVTVNYQKTVTVYAAYDIYM
jgi:hypothetical protein